MSSREKILNAVRQAQPAFKPLPDLGSLIAAADATAASASATAAGPSATVTVASAGPSAPTSATAAPFANPPLGTTLERFTRILEAIGGKVNVIAHPGEMIPWIEEHTARGQRVLSGLPELSDVTETIPVGSDPHGLENVGLAILRGHFGVAENGAIWITEEQMGIRALPFITEHLALVISAKDLVDHMHAAYERINGGTAVGASDSQLSPTVSGFGTFIAGPSKTADIEQSLVLGAHGPVGMTVFILA
jgi:L-lactate dehydrogenase complex protein LldG